MNSNTPTITKVILNQQRELRSRTSSSISPSTQNRSKNNQILRRSNSAKTPSSSSKTKKKVTLVEDNNTNELNELSEEMDQDSAQQTTASNFNTDSTINIDPVKQNQNQNETDNFLNVSNETVDEEYQVKRTTTATRKDVTNYFIKQLDGGFKCNLCLNSNKVTSSAFG